MQQENSKFEEYQVANDLAAKVRIGACMDGLTFIAKTHCA